MGDLESPLIRWERSHAIVAAVLSKTESTYRAEPASLWFSRSSFRHVYAWVALDPCLPIHEASGSYVDLQECFSARR